MAIILLITNNEIDTHTYDTSFIFMHYLYCTLFILFVRNEKIKNMQLEEVSSG